AMIAKNGRLSMFSPGKGSGWILSSGACSWPGMVRRSTSLVCSLAECLVLPARAGRAETVVELLAGWETVVLPVTAEDAVGLARLRAGSGLKMPDCVVVHAAMTVGAQLATFDSRLADVARSRGLSVVT
ncbi:MAG: PIN domain-containing protein, partial [Actinomycetota bacterium]|nr:PIN domain-containing protein [Actinomycetota bacterium]